MKPKSPDGATATITAAETTAQAAPAPGEAQTVSAFARLGLDARLVAAVSALGYEEPTPIQLAAIPPLLEGKDVLGQAATGTGKTAAFALPLLQRIAADKEGPRGAVRALVLCPTRELAMQVAQAIERYGKEQGARVLAVYGGASILPQLKSLKRGIDVVVATPGRALDHLRRGSLKLDDVRVLVLDEADEMLDLGFADDLEAILSTTPQGRQTALFSATMPARIASIASRHLREPAKIKVTADVKPGELPKVRQVAYIVPRHLKLSAIARVLDFEMPSSALVFCRTRNEVDMLTEELGARGYRAEALHGGLSQESRDRVVGRLRNGLAELLIATDVAARGLDIPQLSHVVNFDLPSSPEVYIHRVGRTGRAGREGTAVSLCEPRELRLQQNIERLTKRKLEVLQVPTIAALRHKHLERLQASLREAMEGPGLEPFKKLVSGLAAEGDPAVVAAAAIKLLHEARTRPQDKEEIPSFAPRGLRDRAPARDGRAGDRQFRDARPERPQRPDRPLRAERSRETPKTAPPARPPSTPPPALAEAPRVESPRVRAPRERTPLGEPPAQRAPRSTPKDRERPRPDWPAARLVLGVGRNEGLRPADLVGAMTHELGLSPRAIGAIEIGERQSFVEVPERIADDLAAALRETRIKGKTVTVARYVKRGGEPSGEPI